MAGPLKETPAWQLSELRFLPPPAPCLDRATALAFLSLTRAGQIMRRTGYNHGPLPVHAHLTGDGWESNGISYEDYSGMSLTKRKVVAERRLPTPEWALNDSRMRSVIVRALELRANFRKPQLGTPKERLERTVNRRLAEKPRLEELVAKNCHAYVALKKAGNDPLRVQELGALIESMDTELRFMGKEPELLAGVIYRYYRLNEDSVAVGKALAIKPPHVRQILWRLHKAARAVATEVRVSMRINVLRGIKFDPAAKRAKGEKRCWVCGVLFTPVSKLHKFCKPLCRRKAKAAADKKRPNRGGKHAPSRYFCSDTCKETGWNIRRTMLVFKPAVGQFAPPPSGDAYDSYAAYCKVVGTEPISRDQFSLGVVKPFGSVSTDMRPKYKP